MESLTRNSFSCDPTYLTPDEELFYLHLPLLIYGVIAIALSISAINILTGWKKKSTSAVGSGKGVQVAPGSTKKKKKKKSATEVMLEQVARSLARPRLHATPHTHTSFGE